MNYRYFKLQICLSSSTNSSLSLAIKAIFRKLGSSCVIISLKTCAGSALLIKCGVYSLGQHSQHILALFTLPVLCSPVPLILSTAVPSEIFLKLTTPHEMLIL